MEDYSGLLHAYAAESRRILGDNLVGVYLHGSAAMGGFHRESSDIDLIVVVQDQLSDGVKGQYMERVVSLNRIAPAKGIEMSIVRQAVCRPFQYPTPFELHFSAAHLDWYLSDPGDYIRRMKGTDRDLAAHFTVIRRRGRTLWGKEKSAVFAEVDPAAYFDSIWRDVRDAEAEIENQPVYLTLNLCRVLAYRREGSVLSKEEGGRWGLANLPAEYENLVKSALLAYEAGDPGMMSGLGAREFAAYMLGEIAGK